MRRAPNIARMGTILLALCLPQLLLAACGQTATAGVNTTTATPGAPTSTPTPSVVYMASTDGNLYALDSLSGALEWKIPAAGCAAPQVSAANGMLYLVSCAVANQGAQSTCHVRALRASDHALVWDSAIDGAFIDCAISVSGGIVYASVAPCSNTQTISTAAAGLYALRASDGKRLWRAVVANAQSLANGGCPYYSSPALTQDTAYFSAGDGLYAARLSDGGVTQLATLQHGAFTAPFLAAGVFYAGGAWSSSGTIEMDQFALFAFSTASAQQWKHDLPSFSSAPVVVDGVLYTSAGDVYALKAADGAPRWTFALGGAGLSPATPAVAGGVVYAGGPGGLAALHASDGSLLWRQAKPAQYAPAPVLGGDTAYFGADDNRLYALTASTGAVRWSYQAGGPITAVALG
jgi:outer membrane protein assembly factor BamB